jgi:S-phase kinase-associated protein 1
MSSFSTPKIELVSNNGDVYEVDVAAAKLSNLVETILEDAEPPYDQVPLPNVDSDTLKRIVDFMNEYSNSKMERIEKPLRSSDMKELVGTFARFVDDITQEQLFELIKAANYMYISPLLDLSCAKVATMIRGKTPEEIRKTFNIVNDFTPEEEQAVREENKWCEE